MRRRDFIRLLGGTAAWPFAVRAQQQANPPLVGILSGASENNPEAHGWIHAFADELKQHLGTNGPNVHIESRWTASDSEKASTYAAELISLKPDVILAHGTPPLLALHRVTYTIPIVFVQAAGIVELGLANSMAHPGGNITGFTNFDYPIGGKWFELLNQLAPRANDIGVLMERGNSSSDGYLHAISDGRVIDVGYCRSHNSGCHRCSGESCAIFKRSKP